MVNHTIHTCEQRVRFPLSAIVILFTILPLFSILHHTYTNINLPISIHQTQTKPHHHLYYISVSILHSYKPNYIFISYHTHHYLSYQDIYYLTYYSSPILLIIYIYYTNLQSKYTLSKIDIYLYIYILHTQLLLTYLHYTIITHLLTTEIQNPLIYSLISSYHCIYTHTYPYFHILYI